MELVNVSYAGSGLKYQTYSAKDDSLVVSNFINSSFGDRNDYIESFIYSENGELLDINYNLEDYYPNLINPTNDKYSNIELNPEKDVKSRGYNRGITTIQYNFLKTLFNSNITVKYWIKEISLSRTEIKLSSQVISDDLILNGYNSYLEYKANKNYYTDFYLNMGANRLLICTNVAYSEDDNGSYLLIKLYEPLPQEFDVKDQLWIVDKLSDSVSYNVNIQVESTLVTNANYIKGPNFKIPVQRKNGQTTPYYNYKTLFSSSISQSESRLKSYYDDRAISINVDYTNFSNFIHFSNAESRVLNFTNKVKLIESYSAQISALNIISNNTSQTSITSSVTILNNNINDIITKFDVYEYYLYFQSQSFSWPKRTLVEPYELYSATSSQVINWLGDPYIVPNANTASILFSASYFDYTNKDALIEVIPQYLREDENNQPYIDFVKMIAQHFDNIWLYYKDVSNRFNASNDPNTGISLDLVSEALESMGFPLFTNTNLSDNLYYSLFGYNPDGSLLPPTGSEKITNYVTSSIATLSSEDIQNEIYKRIYHNLPLLLKTKGTRRGIQYLINCYGIPKELLTINEFGGFNRYDKIGVYEINNDRINVLTSSVLLSSSLLNPYVTIQQYNTDNRLNLTNLEVGFSPSDQIYRNITGSLGYFNIDQLIGGFGNQYSSSYTLLDSASNSYFSSYTYNHTIYEFIRLLKYYNNSLFKTVKTLVPARAAVSNALIIKPHVLERSKYKRNEPSLSLDNAYSQSIDLIRIEASYGGSTNESTECKGYYTTLIGDIPYTSSDNVQRFNGELCGSKIIVTNGLAQNQADISSNISGSGFIEVNYGALYQNVSQSVRSKRFFDVDYSMNQNVPVNLNLITYSIDNSIINNFATYNDIYSPYAYIQDYYYYTNAWTVPRYFGSKNISRTYSTYTSRSVTYGGDDSYGETAAIDKIKLQYAYLVDIYTSSFYMPGRSNAQIKYLIDNQEDVLDLTKTNQNIFSIQNIFKSGENADVSLFQYDEKNPYSQQLVNNPTLQIFEGGFRYLPILHNVSGSSTITQSFSLINPEEITIDLGSGALPDDAVLQESNWSIDWNTTETVLEPCPGGTSNYRVGFNLSFAPTTPYDVIVTITTLMQENGTCGNVPRTISVRVNAGLGSINTKPIFFVNNWSSTCIAGGGTSIGFESAHWPIGIENCSFYISDITAVGGISGPTTGANSITYYTSEVSSSYTPCLYFISESNQLVFDSTIAHFYNKNGIVFNSISDTSWDPALLDVAILPFNLAVGDRVSLYDSASRLGWNEKTEYVVKNTRITGSGETGSRLLVEVDRPINLALFASGTTVPIDTLTNAPHRACRYVVWKHVPDETNVMLRYNPKDSRLVENGILFPQYIDKTVRDNSGNVIKSLKQQNLI
jgi:hypothetical protein